MRSHPALGLLVGLPVLLLVLYTIGGLTEVGDVGLPTVPLATLLALPVDLWLRDLATALTLGATVVAVIAPGVCATVRRLAVAGAIIWLTTLAGQVVLTVSEVFALSWSQVAEATALRSLATDLLTRTDLGRVILAQAALVTVALLLVALGRRRELDVVALGVIVIAAWLPGLTGHAGMDHGHVAATIGLGLHLVFASAWVGGLIATAVYIAHGGADPALMLRRFSVLALISVLAVAETGLLNASLRLDGPAALVTSPYGAILLAKVGVLLVLIGWGRRHRIAIADGWAADERVPVARSSTFVRWVAWEVMWMGAIYGLSIALSRTAPPGVVLPGDHLATGAIVMLLIGIPWAIVFVVPSVVHRLAWARSYPEALAVAGVVVVIVAATWQSSLLAAETIGLQLAATLTAVLLVGCGLLLAPAVRASVPAAVILLVGLPVAIWWVERDVVGGLGAGTWGALLLAEGLIAWAAFGSRQGTSPDVQPPVAAEASAVDDQRARQEVTR